jgi:hypothetical protein
MRVCQARGRTFKIELRQWMPLQRKTGAGRGLGLSPHWLAGWLAGLSASKRIRLSITTATLRFGADRGLEDEKTRRLEYCRRREDTTGLGRDHVVPALWWTFSGPVSQSCPVPLRRCSLWLPQQRISGPQRTRPEAASTCALPKAASLAPL